MLSWFEQERCRKVIVVQDGNKVNKNVKGVHEYCSKVCRQNNWEYRFKDKHRGAAVNAHELIDACSNREKYVLFLEEDISVMPNYSNYIKEFIKQKEDGRLKSIASLPFCRNKKAWD